MVDNCDLVIIGGGQAGIPLAQDLAAAGKQIVLRRVLINECPLLGANRTRRDDGNDANDPQRTLIRFAVTNRDFMSTRPNGPTWMGLTGSCLIQIGFPLGRHPCRDQEASTTRNMSLATVTRRSLQ
jgi:choline dehydrogenase-like flavoprotein